MHIHACIPHDPDIKHENTPNINVTYLHQHVKALTGHYIGTCLSHCETYGACPNTGLKPIENTLPVENNICIPVGGIRPHVFQADGASLDGRTRLVEKLPLS